MKTPIRTTAQVENIYNAQYSILISRWYTFVYTSTNEFKQFVRDYFEVVKCHKPKYILLDSVQAYRVIGVETQTWIVENFHYLYNELQVLKMAVLVSEDAFMAVSIEQTLDEDTKSIMQVQYFDNEDLAMEWLKEE